MCGHIQRLKRGMRQGCKFDLSLFPRLVMQNNVKLWQLCSQLKNKDQGSKKERPMLPCLHRQMSCNVRKTITKNRAFLVAQAFRRNSCQYVVQMQNTMINDILIYPSLFAWSKRQSLTLFFVAVSRLQANSRPQNLFCSFRSTHIITPFCLLKVCTSFALDGVESCLEPVEASLKNSHKQWL